MPQNHIDISAPRPPKSVVRREKWKGGKYWTVGRSKGRFVSVARWTSRPVTFSKEDSTQYIYVTNAKLKDGQTRTLTISSPEKYNMRKKSNRKQLRDAIKKKYARAQIIKETGSDIVEQIKSIRYRYTYNAITNAKVKG